MIVGLTGGIGSGKTTVLQYFKELGAEVLSSDDITRDLMQQGQPAYQNILDHFGPEILTINGDLDRSKIRTIIFEEAETRHWLEKLLHPLVKDEILKLAIAIKAGKYLIVEIPLLIEAEFMDAVDRVLVIDCDETIQMKRITARDSHSSSGTLKAIIARQVSRETRLQNAHDVIENEGTLHELRKKVEKLDQFYRALIDKEIHKQKK